MVQTLGDGTVAAEPPKKEISDRTVTVVPPGSARDELLGDWRVQIKSKK